MRTEDLLEIRRIVREEITAVLKSNPLVRIYIVLILE